MDLSRLKIDRGTAAPAVRSSRPSRGRIGFPVGWLIGLGLAAGAVWLFRAPLMHQIDKVRLPKVAVARVISRSPAAAGAMSGAAANGHVVARVKAALSADTPGRIVELNVEEGQRVAKGFVVARLYSAEYEAALAVAEADRKASEAFATRVRAELQSAEADSVGAASARVAAGAAIDEAQAQLDMQILEEKRVQEIVASGDENQRRLDQAIADRKAAAARLESAKARRDTASSLERMAQSRIKVSAAAVEQAEADVLVKKSACDQAAATLDKTSIRAPFDGIVVLKDAEVGEVVSPNVQSGSNARGSVATMVDFASLEVQAEVHESSISSVKVGGAATIFLDAYPGKAYRGRVDRIWPTANRQKATIEVRTIFLEPDDRLRPEMGVRIVFNEADPSVMAADAGVEQLLVPEDAIMRAGANTSVFVVERGALRQQTVKLGERRGDQVVVEDGLVLDETVVRNPAGSLQDGDRVQVEGSK